MGKINNYKKRKDSKKDANLINLVVTEETDGDGEEIVELHAKTFDPTTGEELSVKIQRQTAREIKDERDAVDEEIARHAEYRADMIKQLDVEGSQLKEKKADIQMRLKDVRAAIKKVKKKQ